MKKLIIGALGLALFTASAQAQTTPHSEDQQKKERKHTQHHKGFEQLNLTDEQKAQLKSLKENLKKESEALKNNTSLTKEQKQAAKKELHDKWRAQAEAILTPAQKEQLQKMKSEKGTKPGHDKKDKAARPQKGPGVTKGRELPQELNLTQDQQTKLQQLRADYRTKFETLRNDNTLSQEQKKAKMQDLMKAQKEDMKKILTKEQMEKMQSVKKERTKDAK